MLFINCWLKVTIPPVAERYILASNPILIIIYLTTHKNNAPGQVLLFRASAASRLLGG